MTASPNSATEIQLGYDVRGKPNPNGWIMDMTNCREKDLIPGLFFPYGADINLDRPRIIYGCPQNLFVAPPPITRCPDDHRSLSLAAATSFNFSPYYSLHIIIFSLLFRQCSSSSFSYLLVPCLSVCCSVSVDARVLTVGLFTFYKVCLLLQLQVQHSLFSTARGCFVYFSYQSKQKQSVSVSK